MAIDIRKVRSQEDIDYNFAVLAQALSNITGEQIVGGSIGSGALGGDVVPRSGGSYTGDISAPNIAATAGLSGVSLDVSATANVGALNATGLIKSASKNVVLADQAATESVQGLVKKMGAIAAIAGSVSDPPTQAQVQAIHDKVNSLLASLRAKGLMTS